MEPTELDEELAGGTLATFLLDHGKTYYMDWGTFSNERAIPNRCYRNAALLALADSELTYVEGLGHNNICCFKHAWVVDKQGRIVNEDINDIPKQTDIDRIVGYFGVPFTTAYLRKTLYRNEEDGLLIEGRQSTLDLYAGDYREAIQKEAIQKPDHSTLIGDMQSLIGVLSTR